MTVKVTKPEINVREKLSELDKPSSTAGEELLRAQTHADQMALLGNVQPKNMWINGDQRIWQRGTTRTGIGASLETVVSDRWRNYQSGTAGRCTWSQSTDAPTGYAYSAKLEVTTSDTTVGAGHRWNVAYRMEPAEFEHLGFGKSTGLGFTIQFWVKSSVTGTYSIDVYKNGTNPTCKRNFTIDSPDTWEFKVMTWPHSTFGVGGDVSIWIWLQAGSNYITDRGETWTSSTDGRAHGQGVNVYSEVGNTFFITGLQMTPGNHPDGLPFERRTYSEELALCYRYFQKPGADYDYIWSGDCTSGQTYYLRWTLPVTMRATPTFTPLTTYTSRFGTPSFAPRNNNVIQITAVCNSTGARGYFEGTYQLDAEL
jgi:hypothetical protein